MSLLLALVWSSHSSGQTQSNESEAVPASNTAYFAEFGKDVPERFRPYVNLPTVETPLASDEYPQVARTFAWWARKVLKSEYVPSDTFIAAHIRLFPSTKGRKEDAAFLAYHENGVDYLMVQTGGWNGRVYFITARTDGLTMENETDAKNALSTAIAKYINIPADVRVPEFDVRKGSTIYSLNAKFSNTTRHVLAYAECILSGNDVGLSFRKTLFDEARPAHEPAPDEWFVWEKQKKP
jgi:hypothetical protein